MNVCHHKMSAILEMCLLQNGFDVGVVTFIFSIFPKYFILIPIHFFGGKANYTPWRNKYFYNLHNLGTFLEIKMILKAGTPACFSILEMPHGYICVL